MKSRIVEKLTDRDVKALPLADGGQYMVRERYQRGFGVVVGSNAKTFFTQTQVKIDGVWKTKRKTVGRTDVISTTQGRRLAFEMISTIYEEIAATAPKEMTVLEGWELFKKSRVKLGRSARTIEGYESHVMTHLEQYHDRSLEWLASHPIEIVVLHERLTMNRGSYAANGVMRTLSAMFNYAAKYETSLQNRNPVRLVDFNPERCRQTALSDEQLPHWNEQLSARPNAVRRHFHRILLFTGSRPDALKRAKWADLNIGKRYWNFPRPKGGELRSFDIPLSRPLLRELIALREAGRPYEAVGDTAYLFPAAGCDGHIAETKEDRDKLSHWGNDLRQTFRTHGQLLGIDPMTMHLLMNHKLLDVNAGYVNHVPLWPMLTDQQAKIIEHFKAKMGGPS